MEAGDVERRRTASTWLRNSSRVRTTSDGLSVARSRRGEQRQRVRCGDRAAPSCAARAAARRTRAGSAPRGSALALDGRPRDARRRSAASAARRASAPGSGTARAPRTGDRAGSAKRGRERRFERRGVGHRVEVDDRVAPAAVGGVERAKPAGVGQRDRQHRDARGDGQQQIARAQTRRRRAAPLRVAFGGCGVGYAHAASSAAIRTERATAAASRRSSTCCRAGAARRACCAARWRSRRLSQ